MANHENHQFIELKSNKSVGGMMSKDIMCHMCGEIKTLHEDGRIEMKKKGKMMDKKDDMESMDENKMENKEE